MCTSNRKTADIAAIVRVAIDVDGTVVGFLELSSENLWLLIDHRDKDPDSVAWMDAQRFNGVIRAAVILKLMSRLKSHTHQLLSDVIAQAKIDLEHFRLKSEAAAAAFGRNQEDIEKLVAESNCSMQDFYAFFWKYLLDRGESVAIGTKWELSRNGYG